LIASDIQMHDQTLTALPTRDAMIVPLSILLLAKQEHQSIKTLLQTLPKRFTVSGRLKNFSNETSRICLQSLSHPADAEALLSSLFGSIQEIDTTDGVRITFVNDDIAHFRASGNAPEFRCYNEANSEKKAETMNQLCLQLMESWR